MTEIIAFGASRYQIVTPGRFFPVENHTAENLQDAQVKLNPSSPVYSSALFVLVVLAIGCLYVWRAEL